MSTLQLETNRTGTEYLTDAEGNIQFKTCTSCRNMIEVTEFSVNKRGFCGVSSVCKSCINVRNKKIRKDAGTPTASTVAATTDIRRKTRKLNDVENRLCEVDYKRTGKKPVEISFIDKIIRDFHVVK